MLAAVPPVTQQPVVVFDLDGCLVSSKEISNDNSKSWGSIWSDPAHPCNTEMIKLARALLAYGWHLAILTARPAQYRRVTTTFVERQLLQYAREIGQISLTMYGEDDLSFEVDQHEFKAAKVGQWKAAGVDILFAVEDYKPNADAIRVHVPVLLYESVRPIREEAGNGILAQSE